jgi:hypothetical protein
MREWWASIAQKAAIEDKSLILLGKISMASRDDQIDI